MRWLARKPCDACIVWARSADIACTRWCGGKRLGSRVAGLCCLFGCCGLSGALEAMILGRVQGACRFQQNTHFIWFSCWIFVSVNRTVLQWTFLFNMTVLHFILSCSTARCCIGFVMFERAVFKWILPCSAERCCIGFRSVQQGVVLNMGGVAFNFVLFNRAVLHWIM